MYMKHVTTMSQLLETTMTYAGDVRDYENCNAAMRNIDPDCNLFNFSNTKYYLELMKLEKEIISVRTNFHSCI